MKKLFLIVSFLISVISFATQAQTPLTQRADVKAFMQKMIKKHHFTAKELNYWFNQAHVQPSIIKAMTKPAEKKAWHQYQAIFLTPQRIAEGAQFWQQHQKTLNKAQREYGVPPEIIVGIIGVETFFGKQTGQYSVLDSLVTLGFDYPPRSAFFLSELEQFLLLAREEGWDPTKIKGSYAGAMGFPQFISSSYRRWAVDFDKDGKRELIGNMDDAIGSVAHYFKIHGWKPNQAVVLPVIAETPIESKHKMIANKKDPLPGHQLSDITNEGIILPPYSEKIIDKHDLHHTKFALIQLEGENGKEYYIGANNFYVITRYNHSDHYAMAVFNLGQKIKKAFEQKHA